MLEGLCPNHTFPIKHLLNDCGLMRKFLSRNSSKGEQGKEPAPTTDDAEEKDGGFPTPDGCLMIFRGSAAYDSKCYQKVTLRIPSHTRGGIRLSSTRSSAQSGSPKY